MSDAQKYLESRGWLYQWTTDDEKVERVYLDLAGTTSQGLWESKALIIQCARDAAEERSAWVAFAASIAGSASTPHSLEDAKRIIFTGADLMLSAYRARFGEGAGK